MDFVSKNNEFFVYGHYYNNKTEYTVRPSKCLKGYHQGNMLMWGKNILCHSLSLSQQHNE